MCSVQWRHPRWPWNTFQGQTRRRCVSREKLSLPWAFGLGGGLRSHSALYTVVIIDFKKNYKKMVAWALLTCYLGCSGRKQPGIAWGHQGRRQRLLSPGRRSVPRLYTDGDRSRPHPKFRGRQKNILCIRNRSGHNGIHASCRTRLTSLVSSHRCVRSWPQTAPSDRLPPHLHI